MISDLLMINISSIFFTDLKFLLLILHSSEKVFRIVLWIYKDNADFISLVMIMSACDMSFYTERKTATTSGCIFK